jgi:signal transduction histidine kinase
MTGLAVLLGIVSVGLLFLFVISRLEIRNVTKQLKNVRTQDTNGLVHSTYGNPTTDRLINEINEMLRELRRNRVEYSQKSHALEQMITNISHDLRTPLTSAMGYINLINNSPMSEEEKRRETAIVEQRLVRLEELINSFFELSKIISQDKAPELQRLNLTSVLEESIAHYFDDYSGRGREIVFDCTVRRVEILSNRNMLMRIFDNLIGNAYKHGTGNLTVSVDCTDGVRIRFMNKLYDGELEIDRIFDEFYTTDISRTKGNTGLGLAIAKQFTEMLGGDISAEYSDDNFVVTVVLKTA